MATYSIKLQKCCKGTDADIDHISALCSVFGSIRLRKGYPISGRDGMILAYTAPKNGTISPERLEQLKSELSLGGYAFSLLE